MIESVFSYLRDAWNGLQGFLFFLPPFPERIDTLALLSLVLVVGLLVAEWLRSHWQWPRVLGYVVAGTVFGPPLLGWIKVDILTQIRPFADAAHGLLLLEAGRRLDLRWLAHNRDLLRGTVSDIALSFLAIFLFALLLVGLSPAWAAATAAVTMASAPAVVLLVVEESRAQGQVTERVMLYSSLSAAASFVVFIIVLGVVHTYQSGSWAHSLTHPLWAGGGAYAIGWAVAQLTLRIAGRLPKRSLAQVFVLVAMALLAVGIARMLAVPVFLTLFLMGVLLSLRDEAKTLSYTSLPEGHWMLAIILFVVVGASLPWREFTWLTGLQAIGLLLVRALAKTLSMALAGGELPLNKRLLAGLGIQPLSATAVFMAFEISRLYPEIGGPALLLAFFAAAIMDIAGPVLCRFALVGAGETPSEQETGGNGA